ncbi:Hypothetical predicted protein [Olea europaea subsp. europaea]|uniref:Uncharacterized protein n=1 Tax=Olea europaea subsp. europaea TaxID=158383 RepID=A0A8S0PDL4_OLEEU|nr:Hypothetical predicted protein [Olea europaea subsp. europaea]
MFEDSAHDDHHDEVPIHAKSSGSSDELEARDRAAASLDVSPSEKVAAKIDNFIGLAVTDLKTCMKELLSTGRLEKGTDLYLWMCTSHPKGSKEDIGHARQRE